MSANTVFEHVMIKCEAEEMEESKTIKQEIQEDCFKEQTGTDHSIMGGEVKNEEQEYKEGEMSSPWCNTLKSEVIESFEEESCTFMKRDLDVVEENVKIEEQLATECGINMDSQLEKDYQCDTKEEDIFKIDRGLKDSVKEQKMSAKQFPALVSSKMHVCPVCNHSTTFKGELIRHIVSMHSKANSTCYKCESCQYVTYNKSSYTTHLSTHMELMKFVCSSCSKRFRYKKGLDYHIIIMHRDNRQLTGTVTHKVHSCLHCNYETVSATNFTRHLRQEHKL